MITYADIIKEVNLILKKEYPGIKRYGNDTVDNAVPPYFFVKIIPDYQFYLKDPKLHHRKRIAFFPGTFDPFSLGHKGIVKTILSMEFQVYLALDEFS